VDENAEAGGQVNNSGISQTLPVALLEEEDWDRVLDIASPYECGNKVRSSLRLESAALDESRLELKVGLGSAVAFV
jgi:hypothetical protein